MPLDHSLRWQISLLRLFEGARAAQGATLLELDPASPSFVQAARMVGLASRQDEPADIVVHWSFSLAARDRLRQALHEGSSFLFATTSRQSELKKALALTFGKDVALIEIDASPHESSPRLGLARLGGLLPSDLRAIELLTGRLLPAAGEEASALGPELGWFYASWGQLAALDRLIAAGGLREEDATGLKGALLFEKGALAEALPLLEQAVRADPLLGPWPWLVACKHRQLHELELVQSRQKERAARLQAELAAARGELAQQRSSVEGMQSSTAWKLSRGLTRAIAMVPLGQATVAGLGMLQERGPLATLGAVRGHLRYRLQRRADVAQRELNRMARLARARRIASALTGRKAAQNSRPSAAPRPVLQPVAAASQETLRRYRSLPLLSAVVVGKDAKSVAACVRHVLAQSYPNLEVLVLASEAEAQAQAELRAALGELLDLPAVRLCHGALAASFQLARGEFVTWMEAGSSLAAHDFAKQIDELLAQPGFARPVPGECPAPLRVYQRSADASQQPAAISAVPAEVPARPLRATLLIDTLDVGGLEEVVAFLANNLGTLGIQPSVICFQSGGQVAERLRSQGHAVLVADGDPERLAAQLRSQSPDVVNTHFAHLDAVKTAHALGRPIVETIHNTYIWLDAARWQAERQRSQYFSAALAVSGLVSRYYQAHNPDFPAQKITVAGNAIDPARLAPIPMAAARQILDMPEHATLFVSLGRYCYQKNQLGLLRAFAQVAEREPSAHLLLVGNIAQDALPYYQLLGQVRDALPCAERVRIEPFRSDVATVLSAADAMVLDSYFEGWSLAATEALLVGTPLIHSVCGSAEELCTLGEGSGIVIPNPGGDIMTLDLVRISETAVLAEQSNHAALVAALTRIAAERPLWRGRREAIAATAARMFHPTAILHRYARAFRRVAPAVSLSDST